MNYKQIFAATRVIDLVRFLLLFVTIWAAVWFFFYKPAYASSISEDADVMETCLYYRTQLVNSMYDQNVSLGRTMSSQTDMQFWLAMGTAFKQNNQNNQAMMAARCYITYEKYDSY